MPGVDTVAGLLDGPRARDAFLLRSLLRPPWALRIEDGAPLTLVAVTEGSAFLTVAALGASVPGGAGQGGAGPDRAIPGGAAPNAAVPGGAGRSVRLDVGDVAVLRGPDPYTVADAPDTQVQVAIRPGQVCHTVDHDARPMTDLGVRTWGNLAAGRAEPPDVSGRAEPPAATGRADAPALADTPALAGEAATPETVLLTGTYQLPGETSRRLLRTLPPLVLVRAGEWPGGRANPLLGYLADEIVHDEPGQGAVLDRLLDLLLIAVLRAWFARPEAAAPGWYSAHGDPVVGPALRLLHHQPAHPWTVAELAGRVGVSRAAFARRFHELVGETPMAFLTEWRLTLAADLLREPGATVGSVARQVGYASPYALSTAFTRVRGITPRQHRERAG